MALPGPVVSVAAGAAVAAGAGLFVTDFSL